MKPIPGKAAVVAAACTLAMVSTGAMTAHGEPATQSGQRLAVYYQTQYFGDAQTYVSPVPLVDNGATDVIVGAIHLNDAAGDTPVTLNDHAPDHPRYDQMWTDLANVQSGGAHVIGMVGGAARGSFERLDSQFDTYYPLLREVITAHHLDGVDLDVEEDMSLTGVERLIDALRADFGTEFIITLAPVATALSGGGNLSGFDYDDLYADRGAQINWFNTQFYCGWGDLSGTAGYEAIVGHGVVPAAKVVAGTLTNPDNCGSGYVDLDTLVSTIAQLKGEYPDFGGISGWEYFNSLPGGTQSPWQWAAEVSDALGR